jgi:hypothetical protein
MEVNLSDLVYVFDGETVFDFGRVKAKCGRLVMFPPCGAKYIMSSYLHYS